MKVQGKKRNNYIFIRIVCQREKCPISTRVIVSSNPKNQFGQKYVRSTDR